MPPSQLGPDADKLVIGYIKSNKNLKVIDIGSGYGKWAQLLSKYCTIDGIEAHGPYIEKYGLKSLYNNLYHTDVMNFDFKDKAYDVAIIGDCLEHLTYENALILIKRLKEHCNCIFLSLPVTYCPQGATDGNEYEIHRYDWSDMEVRKTLGMKLQVFSLNELAICCIGLYFWSK